VRTTNLSATRFLHKSPFWATGGRCPPYIISLFPDPEKPPLKKLRCTLMILLQSLGLGDFFLPSKNISYLSGSREAPSEKA